MKILRILQRIFPHLFFIPLLYRSITVKPERFCDIGCGKGQVVSFLINMDKNAKFRYTYRVGLDVYLPYLLDAKKIFHDVIRCDVRFLPIKPSSIDVALATDLIEHLKKTDGFNLLTELDKITKRQIIIMTPVLTQLVTYRIVEVAYHMLCIKNKDTR